MLPVPQVICPMEEDARAACTAPPSECQPRPQSPPFVTCRVLTNDVRRKQARRRSGRLKLAKELEGAVKKGARSSSGLTKRMARSTVQVTQSLSVKLIRIDSPLKNQKTEHSKSSSIQDQSGLTMSTRGHGSKCVDPAASMLQEKDSVTRNAETELEAGRAEDCLEEPESPESPLPVKQWVIGPLLQTFKSKMASFTEIVMTPVRFFKTSPSSSDCSGNPVNTDPSEDSDGCLNSHGLHPEKKTEGDQKGTESSIKNVENCYTSLKGNKMLKSKISKGIINESRSCVNNCCTDRNGAVRKSSAVQKLKFEAEVKVQSPIQEQDFVLFDERNSDDVFLREMDGQSDSCIDNQVVSVREGEQELHSDLCQKHPSGTETGTDSSSEKSCRTDLSLSSNSGTPGQREAFILLRRLDNKCLLEHDSTPDCPRKRLRSLPVEAGLVFSEVSSVLSELREGHDLKESSGPVTHETVISMESDHLTPLKYYTPLDSLILSGDVEEAGVGQGRILESVDDGQPSTISISWGQRNTDIERKECTTSLSSLSRSSVSPENMSAPSVQSLAEDELQPSHLEVLACPLCSPSLEGPSSTEEKDGTEESCRVQPEGHMADCRGNIAKQVDEKMEEDHTGKLLSASTDKIRRGRRQLQRRSGRMCNVRVECHRVKGEAVSTKKQISESGRSESLRGREASKGRRMTSKKKVSPVTQEVASTKRLAVNCLKNLPLDLTDGSVGNSGSDRSINSSVPDPRKCRRKGRMSRCPELPNAVRTDCSPCPSEEHAPSLSDCTKISCSTRVSATMTITIAREEEEGGMVSSSTGDGMHHTVPNTRYQRSSCRKRGSNPEIAAGLTAKCKKGLDGQGVLDDALQTSGLKEMTKTHSDETVNLGQSIARKRKHKTLCSATKVPKKLYDGPRGAEVGRSRVVDMHAQGTQSEGLGRDCEIGGGTLQSRDSSAAELNPKKRVGQHLGKDASSSSTLATPMSPFKIFTPLTSSLYPSDNPVVVEGNSVDGCTSCVKADQSGNQTPAPPVGGLPSYCEEEIKAYCAPGLAASRLVVKLEKLETTERKAREEKIPGIVSSSVVSSPVQPRRGWRMKTVKEQKEVSGSGPLHARLLRSRSCPEIPLSLLEDCWSTLPCPSPPHSTLQHHSPVYLSPSPTRRTRRHTVCSVEVEREIAPLCLRKEVYPTGCSATSPSCTSLMVLASCFLSSPLAFLSQKHGGSSCSPRTGTGGSSSRDSTSSSSSSSFPSYPSPASPVVRHLFPGSSTSAHSRTGQPTAFISPLCSASSQVSLEGPSPGRLQQEEETSQSARTREEKALSYSEIKQVNPVKRGDLGKVSRIRIRRAVPKPPANLTPMGLPKPVRVKKKAFSLEEIYTNKNFQKPAEGRLETVFEVPLNSRDGSVSLFSQRRFKRLVDFPELGVARKPKKPLIGSCGKPAMGRTRRAGGARGRESPALSLQELDSLLRAKLSQLDSWIIVDQGGELA